MWTDDHISRQLLAVHLDGDVDLASRKTTTITDTVNWILTRIPGEGMDVLDLGCGPGLYAERFAAAGHRVHGMDVSSASLEYARHQATRIDLGISYELSDYTRMTHENAFDLAMLVYTDLGVLLPEARGQVLQNVYRALRPGGVFVFDVLNVPRRQEKLTPKTWDVQPGGFWRDHPYLALSESFFSPDNDVILYQHTVGDDKGVDVYRFWTQLFSESAIREMILAAGFTAVDCYTDVLPANDVYSGENVTFCIARK
jgi:SAM-dependent methyltransferase